jgi:methyl-accepting chemotaxis protein
VRAFSAMCGYTLEELLGKKLGPILQGEKTDRETAERLRRAVHGFRPCREVILNYRKNGESYLAEVAITPILDGDGQPLWLAARERELIEGIPA